MHMRIGQLVSGHHVMAYERLVEFLQTAINDTALVRPVDLILRCAEKTTDSHSDESVCRLNGHQLAHESRLDRGDRCAGKLRAAVGTISGAPLNVVTEADLYAAQSVGTANLIRLFEWPPLY